MPATHEAAALMGIHQPRERLLAPLKKLSGRHLRIVGMHLAGFRAKKIAEQLKITPQTVYNVLGDPLAQKYLAQFWNGHAHDLRSLMPEVITTLEQGLKSGNAKIRLSAVEKFIKVHEMLNGGDTGGKHNIVNFQINVQNDARVQLVQQIKELHAKSHGGTSASAGQELEASSS